MGIVKYGPRYKILVVRYKSNRCQKEILAIEHCTQKCLTRSYQGARMHILSDSQTALKALAARTLASKLTWNSLSKLFHRETLGPSECGSVRATSLSIVLQKEVPCANSLNQGHSVVLQKSI